MNDLEKRYADISKNIFELRAKAEISLPSEDMIKRYLEKDRYIKNKGPEEQKRIIRTYVKRVTVFEDFIDVSLIVDIDGGGGGN